MKTPQFTFRASNSLTMLLIIAHSIAMVSVAFIPLPIWAGVMLSVTLLASMIFFILRYALLVLGGAWVAISLEKETVQLVSRNGHQLNGVLLNSSVVTPLCVILNVATQEHRLKHSVVVMADSMDAESFRQLRVALKWRVNTTA